MKIEEKEHLKVKRERYREGENEGKGKDTKKEKESLGLRWTVTQKELFEYLSAKISIFH